MVIANFKLNEILRCAQNNKIFSRKVAKAQRKKVIDKKRDSFKYRIMNTEWAIFSRAGAETRRGVFTAEVAEKCRGK
jgi:hypothetical protein